MHWIYTGMGQILILLQQVIEWIETSMIISTGANIPQDSSRGKIKMLKQQKYPPPSFP